MSIKIGIIGETGQLARALKTCCAEQGLVAITFDRKRLDLTQTNEEIMMSLESFGPVDVIINAAAYTAVDQAETDQDTAYRINASSVKCIAQYCASGDIAFIHISTDYVFNGENNTPYKTSDSTEPLGVYGYSKLQGEMFIRDINGPHAIIRTSWVYDGISQNFMTTMLRLAKEQESLRVVNDQLGRPTYAKHLALAVLATLKPLLKDSQTYSGTYHVTNSGPIISWADFARAIFEVGKKHLKHPVEVVDIPSYWSYGLEQAMAQWQNLNDG